MQTTPTAKRTYLWLFLIIAVGLVLRLYKLDYQSLWLDELNSMKVSDPDESWAQLFAYLKLTDQHPPLHFIILRFCFAIFGHTSVVLRMVSVVGGVLSIWAMYELGKEFLNKQLGLIAALFTSVSYYLIFYSQEGRNYIFVFLFTALSFLYLIRAFRDLSIKNCLLYALFNILLLYTHYYGMFTLFAQFLLCAVMFFYQQRDRRLKFALRLGGSAAITGIAYLFWLPYLIYVNGIGSFWIQPLSHTIFKDFFYQYFGDSAMLAPLLTAFLLVYIHRVFTSPDSRERAPQHSYPMGFVILFIWVAGSLLVPFLRSYLVVPMLITRYAIGIMPAFIIAVALGLLLIGSRWVKGLLLVCFALFSVLDIVAVKQYYKVVDSKPEYRQMSDYVMEKNIDNFPIVSSYGWQFSYYFKHKNNDAHFVPRNNMRGVDSLVKLVETPQRLSGFWVMDGHSNTNLMTDEEKKELNKYYILAGRKYFYGTWAELYLYTPPDSSTVFIGPAGFQGVPEGYSTVSFWGGDPISSKPVHLHKGKYTVTVSAAGGAAFDVYPIFRLQANGGSLGEFTTSNEWEAYNFELEVPETGEVTFLLQMTNDAMDPATGNDRNGFVNLVWLKKKD